MNDDEKRKIPPPRLGVAKNLGALHLAVAAREVKRGASLAVGGVDVGAAVDELLRPGDVFSRNTFSLNLRFGREKRVLFIGCGR